MNTAGIKERPKLVLLPSETTRENSKMASKAGTLTSSGRAENPGPKDSAGMTAAKLGTAERTQTGSKTILSKNWENCFCRSQSL